MVFYDPTELASGVHGFLGNVLTFFWWALGPISVILVIHVIARISK